MKGARKSEPPAEYLSWIGLANDDWQPSYPINDKVVRDAIVKSLWLAQNGLCVYCGRKLDMIAPGKTFHIEHFRPQHAYRHLSTEFENLFLSCGQEGSDGGVSQTCGTHKGNWFDDVNHVEPVYPDCIRSFDFSLNGEIRASTSPAEKMIEILHLNHKELMAERQQILQLVDLEELDLTDFWDGDKKEAEAYAHMVYKHLNQDLP